MMSNEFKWLLEELLKYGFAGLVGGGIVYLVITRLLTGYLTEKGKNLATKEDIAAITELVKSVEHKYSVIVHEMNSKQQLRMAAVDRRLQAHQEAFALWRKMIGTGAEGTGAIVLECQEWWDQNCLYLEPAVRPAFVDAYTGFNTRQQLFLMGGAKASDITDAWTKVAAFPEIMFKSVQLPILSPSEWKAVVPEDA